MGFRIRNWIFFTAKSKKELEEENKQLTKDNDFLKGLVREQAKAMINGDTNGVTANQKRPKNGNRL